MKVAIPLFGSWVSPRFGFAPEMLIVTIEGRGVSSQHKVLTNHLTPMQRINQLSDLGIEVVICGGIDCFCCRQLNNLGISIVSDVAGEADEALDLFLKGILRTGYRAQRRKSRGCGKGKKFSALPWIISRGE